MAGLYLGNLWPDMPGGNSGDGIPNLIPGTVYLIGKSQLGILSLDLPTILHGLLSMELIVFDLDGTLLNRQSTISDYTSETLQLLSKREIAYTVATGRTLSALIPKSLMAR